MHRVKTRCGTLGERAPLQAPEHQPLLPSCPGHRPAFKQLRHGPGGPEPAGRAIRFSERRLHFIVRISVPPYA